MTKSLRAQLAERADELLQEAFDGCIGVLRNPEAPPTSKATATGNAIRLYELLRGDSPSGKEPSQMTYEELQADIERLRGVQQDVLGTELFG